MAATTGPFVIDADGHMTEPPMVWSNYTERPYRETVAVRLYGSALPRA